MLPERLANNPLDAVTIRCMWQRTFARDYTEPGIANGVAGKKYLEVLVCHICSLQDTIKSIFAQQPVRSGKYSRWTRRRVLHGPWHDVH